jgi:hypothetical protein
MLGAPWGKAHTHCQRRAHQVEANANFKARKCGTAKWLVSVAPTPCVDVYICVSAESDARCQSTQ